MVITQDPRRSYDEMNANGMSPTSDWIGISTPFGLHSLTYRSHKTKGLVHYLFNALQDELQKKYNYNPNDLSIYYTDVYKFRGVAPAKNSNTPNDVIDKPNMKIYAVVLRSEINLYKPDVIILMGKEAQNAWNSISATISSNIPILSTPHPSPQANSKWKAKYPKTSSFTACDKIDLILKELISKLIP